MRSNLLSSSGRHRERALFALQPKMVTDVGDDWAQVDANVSGVHVE